MTKEELLQILGDIQILDRSFDIEYCAVGPSSHGWLIHVLYSEKDVDDPDPNAEPKLQRSRGWFVPATATTGDVVDTAFAAVMRSYDHVVQEHFLYRGRRVFSPHISLDARTRETSYCRACKNTTMTPCLDQCFHCKGPLGPYPDPEKRDA